MTITAVEEALVEAVARAILRGLRPSLAWETAKPETRERCEEAARNAIVVVRLLDAVEGGR
jgi:hypothetical protein